MIIEIIIPAYNCTKTLHRTLSSLDCQTDTDFSVHVIDDCSTEDLSHIIDMHKNLNIRVTRNEKNLGCGMTRQVGIDNTTADYIAFLDSDDVLMPYTVEIWRKMAESNDSIDLFHSYFYEQKNKELVLYKQGYTWCHGKLYKTSFIKKWDIRNNPEVKFADDSFFNSVCMGLGTTANIPIAMYMWLNNTDSITRKRIDYYSSLETIDDFVYAMKLSTTFLLNNGVDVKKHMKDTLEVIERMKPHFSSKAFEEYNELISLINGGD